ncbi:MAG TPA: hypothetical protein DCG33_05300 [Prevotellaceae bacterium]|jgi:hypothetical protein|nr:hypothetical protein [Prevotellaceae bacterium]
MMGRKKFFYIFASTMNKLFSILVVLTSLLVVTHVVVPHHHHHDRIYLLLEESHENHDGHAADENKCHHGDAVAEVLVCASCFVSSNCETLILQPLASFPFTIQSFIALVVKTASPLVCRDIFPFPGPPLLSWGLRAPPAFG